jgi:hypothetical protein
VTDALRALGSAVSSGRDAFLFWQRWLLVACGMTGALGVGLTAFDTRLLPFFSEATNHVFGGTETMPELVVAYHRFTHAVLGATLVGWAVLLAAVVQGPFRRKERWAWSATCGSIAAWVVLDTCASLVLGAHPNAVLNVLSAAAFAIPLGATRRHFSGA